MARAKFPGRRADARIDNPQNETRVRGLGIDSTVSATNLIMAHIEQELPWRGLIPLVTLRGRSLEVVEVRVPSEARILEWTPTVLAAACKPVVSKLDVQPAIYELNWLPATGPGIFCAAVLSAFWLRVGPGRFLAIVRDTCWSMRWPLFTIACMLAIAYVTRFSGMDAKISFRRASVISAVMSVSMKPGATTFAVMLRPPSSRAIDRAKPSKPALLAP